MTLKHSCWMDDRGVSEAIGFLLIFTMVIVGIGLVTLYGYPMLIEQQVNADEKIMEKNMIVLQNDVKSLAYKTVPYKETSLKIGGGAMTVYNSSDSHPISSIKIYDCAGNPFVSAFKSGDLQYSSGGAGTDITLQNGAVTMRRYVEPGSVMLAEPRWFYDTDTNTMVINLIGFNSTSNLSRAGIGTVQMAMGDTNYTSWSWAASAPPPLLCVVYTPDPVQDYSTAWGNYFVKINPTGPAPVNVGAGKQYQLPTDPLRDTKLVVKRYDVIIKSL
jgi:hypothetical protein